MARGSPWVTPSLLCNKWPDPSPVSLTTSVAQWRYQLKVNCAPLGHSCRTAHIMAVYFSSLNAFRVSMRRNPSIPPVSVPPRGRALHEWRPLSPSSLRSASCEFPQAAFASGPVTRSRHFVINLRHVSPMPTGLIPGCLSRAISRPLINAL